MAGDPEGTGCPSNAGNTRRQGVEAGLGFRSGDRSLDADDSLVDATFRSRIALPSTSPFADLDTGIPRHRLILSAEYQMTSNRQVGADLKVQSSEYLLGDDGNQGRRLPGGQPPGRSPMVHGVRRDRQPVGDKYFTFGAFTQLDGLPPSFHCASG